MVPGLPRPLLDPLPASLACSAAAGAAAAVPQVASICQPGRHREHHFLHHDAVQVWRRLCTACSTVACVQGMSANDARLHSRRWAPLGAMPPGSCADSSPARRRPPACSNPPLIVRGPGAGPAVTAAGVFSDLITLSRYLGAPS